jgi:SAM-dependent methyltransferase
MRPHWDAKADGWEDHLPQTELFAELLDAVMYAAAPTPRDVAIDLGAGSGFLTVPLVERASRVYAVDNSSAMLERLRGVMDERGLQVYAVNADLRRFAPPEPVDVVVSNYALHHLRRGAKKRLVVSCYDWLRPGGRIAVADIMTPLTLRPGQSGPLIGKVRDIARKGPAGYVRIARNAVRWAFGRGEYPMSVQFWIDVFRESGLADVGGCPVGKESGVVWGRKPLEAPVASGLR